MYIYSFFFFFVSTHDLLFSSTRFRPDPFQIEQWFQHHHWQWHAEEVRRPEGVVAVSRLDRWTRGEVRADSDGLNRRELLLPPSRPPRPSLRLWASGRKTWPHSSMATKKWPNYAAGVYLNSKADLEHLQIANSIVYVWPLTLASQTGVCECVRHLSHRTSVHYFFF